MRLALTAMVIASLPLADQARAAERSGATTKDPWERPLVGELTVGIGTPVGFLGAGLETSPFSWLGIAAGVGGGRFGAEGAFALRPRFVWPSPTRSFALGVGLGASVGAFGESSAPLLQDAPRYTKSWDYVWWLNAELFIEHRERGAHVGGRLFLGEARAVGIGPSYCAASTDLDLASCGAVPLPKYLPYVGGSLEFWWL